MIVSGRKVRHVDDGGGHSIGSSDGAEAHEVPTIGVAVLDGRRTGHVSPSDRSCPGAVIADSCERDLADIDRNRAQRAATRGQHGMVAWSSWLPACRSVRRRFGRLSGSLADHDHVRDPGPNVRAITRMFCLAASPSAISSRSRDPWTSSQTSHDPTSPGLLAWFCDPQWSRMMKRP
jgi:hypothetical protein